MKIIKILGTGCPKCKKTEAAVRETIAKMGIDAKVEKIENIVDIIKYNVMSTPAVVVDEVVKIRGRIPSQDELKELFS